MFIVGFVCVSECMYACRYKYIVHKWKMLGLSMIPYDFICVWATIFSSYFGTTQTWHEVNGHGSSRVYENLKMIWLAKTNDIWSSHKPVVESMFFCYTFFQTNVVVFSLLKTKCNGNFF